MMTSPRTSQETLVHSLADGDEPEKNRIELTATPDELEDAKAERPELLGTNATQGQKEAESVDVDLDLGAVHPPPPSQANESRKVEEEEGEGEDNYVYPDGGYGWVVVVCCAALCGCTLCWGPVYGVFLEYYGTVFPRVSSSVLSLPGTTSAISQCLAGFFAGRLGDRYGFMTVLWASTALVFIGLFSSAWCTVFWQLIITQGIITGIGQGLAVPMFMSIPSQWFLEKRGLANGISMAGAGLGGGICNLVVRTLLTSLGYKKTFIIMSSTTTFVMILSILLLRTRPDSPEARRSADGKRPWVDGKVVKTSAFWALGVGMVVSTMGFAVPFNFLSTWMKTVRPDDTGLLVILPNTLLAFAFCIGRPLAGLFSDLFGAINTFALVFIASGVLQLALWETARSLASILVFAIMFGLIAPGYSSLIPQAVIHLFGRSNLATNVGLVLLFNGPGNFVAGPIAGAIFDQSGGKSFTWVIVSAGCLQIFGGIIVCWVRYKADRPLGEKV